ncbi:MAG: hypothetical protein ACE5DM_01215 [Candidatus Nanoarchaeia archaeon]
MAEEEYAIVSKKEFMKLKLELDKLKKNPLQGSEAGANLQDSIESLNKSLTGMMELFKEASDELKIEERDTQIVSKKLEPIAEKVDTLIAQNQKIAKGIIAVADMVKEKLDEIEEKTSAPKEKKPELPPLPPPMPPPMPETPAGPASPPGPEPMAPMGQPMLGPEMGPMPAQSMPGAGAFPPMGPPGPMPPMDAPPPRPGADMPAPMPAPKGKKKPILGGFLTK